MAGRTRTKKQISQKRQTDAATQTSPDRYLAEITRLKEEANSLRLELHQLKREQQPNSVLQKQTEEVTVAVADSPQQKVPLKGCNCRGKCASRVCGCVKKQIPCTAACKCTHNKCENKDHDKENSGGHNAQAQISPELENNIKLMSSLKLQKRREKEDTERAAGPSVYQPEQAGKIRKGLFSPETPKTFRNNLSVSNLELNTPIRFDGSNEKSDTIYDLFDRRKIRPAVLTANATTDVHSLNRDKSNKKKVKGKSVEQVLAETAASSSTHLDQAQQNSNSEELELEIINPMQPTRQLQRTPVSVSSTGHQPRFQSPPPNLEAIKLEVSSITPTAPPQDIHEPQVDWEEHCKQLVRCKHCDRTFYPHRIEKHESSCKRI